MKNKYFTGQTCGETGTRTFWGHLVISALGNPFSMGIEMEYITIFILYTQYKPPNIL